MKNLKTRLFITAAAAVMAFLTMALPVNAASKNEVSKKLSDIADACSTHAACETDRMETHIIFNDEENPYDVYYDYGEDYEAYIDACDWSLVFDADYYMETFPMLALQYNYDEDQLLKHFQTVGVHEGRQGSEDFNVGAYLQNCDYDVYKAFEKHYAAYYIYYMLNYTSEKKVNTKTADNGKRIYQQYQSVLTSYQKRELDAINKYREEVGAQPVTFDPELAAFANFRTYMNAVEGYKAHDWAIENNDLLHEYCSLINPNWTIVSENTYTSIGSTINDTIAAKAYRTSKAHYEAMIDTEYNYVGISNCNYDGTRDSSQFDIYMPEVDNARHPIK